MKRLMIAGLSLLLAASAFAYTETREINSSSFTTTNDTAVQIPNTGPNTDFRGIIVSSVSATGQIAVFDTQGVATSTKAFVSLGTLGEYHFNVRLSSGLSYTTTTNLGGVTILYHIN